MHIAMPQHALKVPKSIQCSVLSPAASRILCKVLRIRILQRRVLQSPCLRGRQKKTPIFLGPGRIPHLGADLQATICLTVELWTVIFWSSSNHSECKKRRVGGEQPWLKLLCLNPLRLEPGDSRLQTRVPKLGGEGTLDTAGIPRPVLHRQPVAVFAFRSPVLASLRIPY